MTSMRSKVFCRSLPAPPFPAIAPMAWGYAVVGWCGDTRQAAREYRRHRCACGYGHPISSTSQGEMKYNSFGVVIM